MKISIRKSMNKKLGISLSFSLSINETLGGKVSNCCMVIGSMERSNSSIDMVNQLRISFSFPLSKISKSVAEFGCQVILSCDKVCVMDGSDCATRMVNQLAERSSSKARDDQKLHFTVELL